jgi:hypothetical protein
VSTTPVVNLELRISPRIFEKFETVLMGYSGAGGKLIDEKKTKAKISRHCPFKAVLNKNVKKFFHQFSRRFLIRLLILFKNII